MTDRRTRRIGSSLLVVGLVCLVVSVAAAGSPATAPPAPASVAAAASSIVGGPPTPAQDDEEGHLYRTLLLRAAPGRLATVIEMLQERLPAWREAAAVGPFWMRHSQGDQWDLLLLFHLGKDFETFFSEGARARRQAAWSLVGESERKFEQRLLPHVSWRQELFVRGPGPDVVAARFDDAGFFHVEFFLALAGKREELVQERRMENGYLEGIGRDPNLIFTRVAGAEWDCYTIGFYRDLKHFAESSDVPEEREEEAALEAGFESASAIGTYLRSLIAEHHDTLAVALR